LWVSHVVPRPTIKRTGTRRISLRACDARDVQIFMQFIDLYLDNG